MNSTKKEASETKLARFNAVHNQLKALYPVFREERPLKLRIINDILDDPLFQETGIKKPDLIAFFVKYTRYISYLKTFKKYKKRFDLQGKPVSNISREHYGDSQKRLKLAYNYFNKSRGRKCVPTTPRKIKAKAMLSKTKVNPQTKRPIITLKKKKPVT